MTNEPTKNDPASQGAQDTSAVSIASPAKHRDRADLPKQLSEDTPGELTAVVDELLDSLSTKFASVSSEIFEKIEAMSKRLDAMEASLQQSSAPTPK